MGSSTYRSYQTTSTTRGEFDDRVKSLLQHATPGSTVQPCTDNTHDIAVGHDASVLDADMDDATSNEAANTDDIAGISQSTVFYGPTYTTWGLQ